MEQGGMEFQQLPTSYWRLAAHRMSEHYSLRSRIIVRKTLRIRLHLVLIGFTGSDSTFSTGFFQDREVDREDPNHNRKLDHGLGFIGGPSTIQPEYAPEMSGTDTSEEPVSPCMKGTDTAEEPVSPCMKGIMKGTDTAEEPVSPSVKGGGSDSSRFSTGFFQDREVDRKDPNHNRKLDHGLGFSGGPCTIPPKYAPEMSGTIVISLLVDDCIYSGADGRSVLDDDRIAGGNKQKLFGLDGGRVLGTISGCEDFGKKLIEKADERLAFSVSPTEIMAELKREAEVWNTSEELKKSSKSYPTRLGLCGFYKGEPYLHMSDNLSGNTAVREISSDEGKKATIALSGSGSKIAWSHLLHHKDAIFEANGNMCELLYECLACASLYVPSCGGYFKTAILKKEKKHGSLEVNINSPHLIAQVVKSFDRLYILRRSLVHVTRGALYEVWGGKKDEMNEQLKKGMAEVVSVNVIGVQIEKTITVRLIAFKSRRAKNDALRALEGKNKTLTPLNTFLQPHSKKRKMSSSLLDATLQNFETLSEDFKKNSW